MTAVDPTANRPPADHHDPHLAHHFASSEQQMESGKLGMWVFLATEILMFGGLFCVYSVYRHNHPEVFGFAHLALDRKLGALNTVILLTSSLTMAWGVRAAQLGRRTLLVSCLALTILGGMGFMGIKSIEYRHKWLDHIWIGKGYNVYSASPDFKQNFPNIVPGNETPGGILAILPATQPATSSEAPPQPIPGFFDPNAGTADAARIVPTFPVFSGQIVESAQARQEHPTLNDLTPIDRERIATFFTIYFCMTGLHGVHVLVGMGLIFWILLRSLRHEFGPAYFTPVDLVGLYWHLVDLIWIFLFPLLYLIH
jgi:cytochrome c oxidase subunit III